MQELQSKVTVETKRADKSDFEMKRVQDKMSGIQNEKDRLAQEVQSLKESQEELEFSRYQGAGSDANPGISGYIVDYNLPLWLWVQPL